jgi:hypothetical protein
MTIINMKDINLKIKAVSAEMFRFIFLNILFALCLYITIKVWTWKDIFLYYTITILDVGAVTILK